MNLHEIIRENALYMFSDSWRKTIIRWQDLGYWVFRNNRGQLIVRGDDGKEVKVQWIAFGTSVYPVGCEKPTVLHLLSKPEEEIIKFVENLLPPVSQQTRMDENAYIASLSKREFEWKDRARPAAVRLVALKMQNKYFTIEQAVVDTLTDQRGGVCFGFQTISIRTLTGFVSDCWEEYTRECFGKQQRQDGEIERIFAALTGTNVESNEIPMMKPVQLDLFMWFESLAG